MKTFRSIIGWEIWLPVLAIIIATGFPLIINRIWPALAIQGLVILFTILLIIKTRYTITDQGILQIRSWFMVKVDLDIQNIYRIKKTWNPISSPATSLIGRIELYHDGGSIIISPVNKPEFLAALKSFNPAISVKEAQ